VGKSKRRSGGHGSAGDRGPDVEGLGAGGSVLVGGDVIAAEMEEVVDRLVRCQESLRLPRGPEALHLALPPSGGLVGVFGPVVQPLVPTALDRKRVVYECAGCGQHFEPHSPS
jgi:hypothetical protein